MKVTILQLLFCVTVIAILLSGCSGVQNGFSTETPGNETTQDTNSGYSTEMGSDTENLAADNESVANTPQKESNPQPNDNSDTEESTVEKMTLHIGNSSFTATLESNAAVDALVDMMREAPVVVQMSDYSGFEKVGSLGTSLPTSNNQTTTKSGDIVLYNGNQIVLFYGSNSWSYTRLGSIDDLSGWEDALGSGDVAVIFSLE